MWMEMLGVYLFLLWKGNFLNEMFDFSGQKVYFIEWNQKIISLIVYYHYHEYAE